MFYNLSEPSSREIEETPAEPIAHESAATRDAVTDKGEPQKPRESEKTGLFRMFGGASGGIGLEELLILGLALLISQNDTKDDLAFLLLLLVFIK